MTTETIIADGNRFTIAENDHGYVVRRSRDNAEVRFYGADRSELFRNQYAGDLSPLNPRDEAASGDEYGEELEDAGDFDALSPDQEIALAIAEMKRARDRLVRASASKAADKVRAALKSADGALRHAQGKAIRSGKEG